MSKSKLQNNIKLICKIIFIILVIILPLRVNSTEILQDSERNYLSLQEYGNCITSSIEGVYVVDEYDISSTRISSLTFMTDELIIAADVEGCIYKINLESNEVNFITNQFIYSYPLVAIVNDGFFVVGSIDPSPTASYPDYTSKYHFSYFTIDGELIWHKVFHKAHHKVIIIDQQIIINVFNENGDGELHFYSIDGSLVRTINISPMTWCAFMRFNNELLIYNFHTGPLLVNTEEPFLSTWNNLLDEGLGYMI
ncbi:hypothetical protein KAU08_00670, partial [bacterium]|nr:hypothetical protein [bacterium]